MKTKFLFPNRYKRIGWILFAPTAIFGLLIIFHRESIEFLDSKVFTIYGSTGLLRSQVVFGFVQNNYVPTVIGVLCLVGAILIAFSKERQEDEFIAKIRLESLVWATYINYAILIFCFLFFFEMEFVKVMTFNMFTILIFFIARFNYVLHKMNKTLSHEK
jgi:hypothetical protein